MAQRDAGRRVAVSCCWESESSSSQHCKRRGQLIHRHLNHMFNRPCSLLILQTCLGTCRALLLAAYSFDFDYDQWLASRAAVLVRWALSRLGRPLDLACHACAVTTAGAPPSQPTRLRNARHACCCPRPFPLPCICRS